jgi:uncharacterized protein YuzE
LKAPDPEHILPNRSLEKGTAFNFKKPGEAEASELTDDDIIIRYQDDDIIGYTVLHASQRRAS